MVFLKTCMLSIYDHKQASLFLLLLNKSLLIVSSVALAVQQCKGGGACNNQLHSTTFIFFTFVVVFWFLSFVPFFFFSFFFFFTNCRFGDNGAKTRESIMSKIISACCSGNPWEPSRVHEPQTALHCRPEVWQASQFSQWTNHNRWIAQIFVVINVKKQGLKHTFWSIWFNLFSYDR